MLLSFTETQKKNAEFCLEILTRILLFYLYLISLGFCVSTSQHGHTWFSTFSEPKYYHLKCSDVFYIMESELKLSKPNFPSSPSSVAIMSFVPHIPVICSPHFYLWQWLICFVPSYSSASDDFISYLFLLHLEWTLHLCCFWFHDLWSHDGKQMVKTGEQVVPII